jgi:hypothetical protein
MNMHLVAVGKRQLEGLCGTPNGNITDDLKFGNSSVFITRSQLVENPFYGPEIPNNLLASWAYVRKSSLFSLRLSSEMAFHLLHVAVG